MKVGLSTYSLLDAINAGEMDVLDCIDWIKENGGEHMEIVPYGFTLVDNLELADQVRDKAEEVGIELSNYAIPANFVQETQEEFKIGRASCREREWGTEDAAGWEERKETGEMKDGHTT